MSRTRGQASLEMTVAVAGALLLALATVQVFFWITRRLVLRQRYYQASRDEAGRMLPTATRPFWVDPVRISPHAPDDPDRLRFFAND